MATSKQPYHAVLSKRLSKPNDDRYLVLDRETGEILDDAQGYGYKSKLKAYKAYGYKLKRQKENKQL